VKLAYLALPAAAAVITTIAGCSSGPSATTACKDFTTWMAAQHGGYGADPSELASAATAAPPWQLYTVLKASSGRSATPKLSSMVRLVTTAAVAVLAGVAGAAAVYAAGHPAATPRPPAVTRTFQAKGLPCAWPADAQQPGCS
jgi:hypothetical protein